jgi:hypothetical protein
MNISGSISRSNLASPTTPLAINVSPFFFLTGDASIDAANASQNGVAPAASAMKYVWADSSYVAGKVLVLATPDNSMLDLKLLVSGTSMADAQTQVGKVITAISQQLSFQISLTFDSATYTWNCYSGVYQIAFNEMHFYANKIPLHISCPRDPTPASGPV